jgi:hypothetical protein
LKTSKFQLLLATFAGWVGRQQSAVIAYLVEENRILEEQLESGADACDSPTTSVGDWPPKGSHLAARFCARSPPL